MLELRAVSRRQNGEIHADAVTLGLARGALHVLLGPTLAGKTSLLRLMAGLDRPDHGRVFFDGVDVTTVPVRRRNLAMVYQQFINYPGWSVRENIASPLRAVRADATTIAREVGRVAELLGLTPYLERRPLELSGGQQQRVALARALVKRAELVLLDEPLANLDYKLREELRAELPRLFADSGAVVVYATTEPAEALLLGGHTATLHRGRVTQYGPTLEVYRRPADLLSAQIFSDPPLNLLAMRARGGETRTCDDAAGACALPALPDGDWTLAFRPHHLRLGAGPVDALRFGVRVLATEITGSESFVHVGFGALRWVLLAHGVHSIAPGTALEVHVEAAQLLRFAADGARVAAREAA